MSIGPNSFRPGLSSAGSGNQGSVKLPPATVQILKSLGISEAQTSAVTISKSGQTVVLNGMSQVSSLQMTPMLSQYLQQLGLVVTNVTLSLAINGAQTVEELRKKFEELKEDSKSSELADILSKMELPELPDALVFFEENGGVKFLKSGIEKIGEK